MKKLINVISVILVVALLAGLSTMAWKQVSDGSGGGSGKKEKEEVTEAVPVFDPVADGWTHFYSQPITTTQFSAEYVKDIPYGSDYYYLLVFYDGEKNAFWFSNMDFTYFCEDVYDEFGNRITIVSDPNQLSSYLGFGVIEQKPDYTTVPDHEYYFSLYYCKDEIPEAYQSFGN